MSPSFSVPHFATTIILNYTPPIKIHKGPDVPDFVDAGFEEISWTSWAGDPMVGVTEYGQLEPPAAPADTASMTLLSKLTTIWKPVRGWLQVFTRTANVNVESRPPVAEAAANGPPVADPISTS